MSKRNPMVSAIAALAQRTSGDTDATRQLQAELNRLHSRAEALDHVNASRSPLDTPAAHALKVAKMARSFSSEINAAITRAYTTLNNGTEDLQRRIADKVNFKIDAEDAREVRAVFRSMKSSERVAALNKLLKEGRGPELHAILSGSELTTGVDDAMRGAFRDSFVATHASAEMEEKARLGEVMENFDAAQRAASRFVTDLTDPGKLADIERADAQANAAGDAFNLAIAAQ